MRTIGAAVVLMLACGRVGFDAPGTDGPGADAGPDAPSACPAGCIEQVRENRYCFCPAIATWGDARLACESAGARMVRIDDADENAWVSMAATQVLGASERWIGGSDIEEEGVWRWTDGEQFWNGDASGSAVNGMYTNWYPLTPDGGNCLRINPDGLWRDNDCSTPRAPLCEFY